MRAPRLPSLNRYSSPVGAEVPTRARYGVLLLLCTMALVLYLDRVCFGQAEKDIREDLGLEKWHTGWAAAAFTLAYCLFEVPVGHWGDRFGSRGVMARIVVCWSAFTALTGATWGFLSLVSVRFLFGAGEAGAFPNASRVVTRWFPPQHRGKARGAITTTSLIGGALAPMAAAELIHWVGWRWTFAVFGAVGLVWAAIFYRWFRDDPAEHPAVNAAELQLIRVAETEGAADAPPHLKIPWARVLSSPNVWLMGAIITTGAAWFYVLFNWYPTYLKEARGVSDRYSGVLTAVLMTGGALGCLSGGWLADWVVHRTGERKWSRRLLGGGCMLVSCLFVALIPLCASPLAASGCGALSLFLLQLAIPTWWSVASEISEPHGAAMFGLMNSLGGIGAAGAPLAVGWFVGQGERQGLVSADIWPPMFMALAVLLALGAICWLLVDATRSIVKSAELT
jgi:ACS family glucarate transporter-like MFS transporter